MISDKDNRYRARKNTVMTARQEINLFLYRSFQPWTNIQSLLLLLNLLEVSVNYFDPAGP